MSTVVAVVQARMSSQRLPGKVLEPLGTATIIDWVVGRLRQSSSLDDVVVATSIEPSDDVLVDYCLSAGYPVSRGSLHDVLDRVHDVALALAVDHLVRVTADCPLIDAGVVDAVVERHLAGRHDFTANRLPPPHGRTYPIGLDVEVASATALEVAWKSATAPHEREHVMPYLYEEPGRFDVLILESPIAAGSVRWSVDTAEDLAAIRGLVDIAGAGYATTWTELLEVWFSRPDLQAMNATVVQRSITDTDPRATDH